MTKKKKILLAILIPCGVIFLHLLLSFGLLIVILISGLIILSKPNILYDTIGVLPITAVSDSMSIHEDADYGGAFNKGDLIFIKKIDTKTLKKGDIICFRDSYGHSSIFNDDSEVLVTLRILDIIDIETELYEPAVEKYNLLKADYETKKEKYEQAVEDEVDQTQINKLEVDVVLANDEMLTAKDEMETYAILLENNDYLFEVKGDYMSPAILLVLEEEVVGIYVFKIPQIGKILLG